MPRSWPGYVAPALAAAASLLLVLLQNAVFQAAVAAEEAVSPALLVVGLIGLAAPFLMVLLWGGAVLLGQPLVLPPLLAGAWLALSLGFAEGAVVWPLASYALAGLAAGWALVFRLRLDAAVAVVTLAIVPYFVWSLQEVPIADKYDLIVEQYIEARREMLQGQADQKQIEMTLAAEREQQEEVAALALKILPAMFGLGIAGFAAVMLSLVWGLARILGLQTGLAKLPAFGRWRFPFYLVWALVGGLGLFATRQPLLAGPGLNVALAVATVLSIQGAAVQWAITGRNMRLVPRVIYLLVAGFLFLPLVVLGLADQWLNFRKLAVASTQATPEDKNGATMAPDDEADDDVGREDR